ncbi:DUF4440 domain-containing protein [Oleiphilus sp. HI0009]|uniref:SgcJ/EcaC family oxidoreductase n=1 Tax=unclassified Oleiphilus TaxID=2631174 RepID=UPI0007C2B794|nr:MULTISPECIES: SgcJ/EcaC family oxidoreductase [unclassified Oleiphilus]KZX76088.1 DUF4440 domain-containing protein [Oleiphilus sp. HI0009]MCH2159963.1 SgcJ/EcaC family oxidoreductase [Oleiphilaceae bacterium]KZX85531.1 DUF4440 domain-containing protein [Oleiphilus sp. HI0009]KZY61292.1 DUF4440 domain-containing protein [Oleiphilus sp. HI0066]KZY71776.1 DUF4440 domain-containing protein [Oleiphilus sp. HI0067]
MKSLDTDALFNEWNAALKTQDAERVVALYSQSAILLPTLSNQVCRSPQEIKDYFSQFLKLRPQGRIVEADSRRFGEIAINSGVYTFEFEEETLVSARFTFVYHWDGENWKIIEHHSSRFPE